MDGSVWQKRLLIFRKRLHLYPAPEAMPHGRLFWIATGLVSTLVLIFGGLFIFLLIRGHDAYLTNAEDLGNMDQAIWYTLHGQLLHQTICNIISDTNCYRAQGVTRFAIHFEPILLPISLLYLIWPDPRTLLILQTIVVVSGAYPAFWLARLRLRNELAGVAFALLYLLLPAQQAATSYDFHAVTFTAALLLFMLYFMYTRLTFPLFIFALLAMACKEEISLLVVCFGIWSMLFQRRWRTGLTLTLLGCGWALLAFYFIPHLFSPTGKSLLVSRYTDLGSNPVQIVQNLITHPSQSLQLYVLEGQRLGYLHALLSPLGYLPLVVPWIVVLMVPTLTINMASSYISMHSGYNLYQYSAELVPILIFATIEAMVLILWLTQSLLKHIPTTRVEDLKVSKGWLLHRSSPGQILYTLLFNLLIAYILFAVIHSDFTQDGMILGKNFKVPALTPHTMLAQSFIEQIPPAASVSAQSQLVPHVSHREHIYLYPYGDSVTTPAYADYIFLDTSSDFYPFYGFNDYINETNKIIQGKIYHLIRQQDHFMLFERT